MAGVGRRFTKDYQPPKKTGVRRKAEVYAPNIKAVEDVVADNLPLYFEALHRMAIGDFKYEQVNLKTGAVDQLKIMPRDQQAAAIYLINRIVGLPERTDRFDVVSPEVEGAFKVLLGPAAELHWNDTPADAPTEEVGLLLEARPPTRRYPKQIPASLARAAVGKAERAQRPLPPRKP